MDKKPAKKQSFWSEESGDFGIKGIAITVAVIVVIGAVVAIINQNLNTWVTDVWDMFIKKIDDLIK